jgi:hypothetical protein
MIIIFYFIILFFLSYQSDPRLAELAQIVCRVDELEAQRLISKDSALKLRKV